LDDILIYSRTRKEHEQHIRAVLQVLRENQLYAKPLKCDFFKTKVTYLGFIISTNGVKMDPAKIKTIVEWQPLKTVTNVKLFVGFAGFYWR
jgi:hypothetical protein